MQNNSNISKRDSTLDYAKGALIILVVFGHALQYSFGPRYEGYYSNVVFKSIYSFHMPLFMMISGYLFYHSNQKKIVDIIRSKAIAIAIPMCTFILINKVGKYAKLILNVDLGGIIGGMVKDIACGYLMWYLFSLLLNIFLLTIITRLFKDKTLRYVVMFLLFVLSLFISDSILLNVHKFMFPFFCIGYALKENETSIYLPTEKKAYLIVLTILSIGAICWFDRDTYIYTSGVCIVGNYSSQLFIDLKRIVIALLLSYTFMQYIHLFSTYIFKSATGKSQFLLTLGQRSLFIYGLNITFNLYYEKVMIATGLQFEFNYIAPIVFTMSVIFLALLLYRLLYMNVLTRLLFLGKL